MATVSELQAEIARLREKDRIAQNGLATLNRSLQSNQAILARYTDEVASIPRQISALESQLSSIQSQPSGTASQAANEDASQGPNKSTAARTTNNGRIVPPPDTTTPSNAEKPTTSDTGGTTGTNGPTRTTEQTQATNGYNRGINIYTEDGTLSNFRRNPETGELYDASGLPGGVDLTTNPGVGAKPEDAANNSTTTAQTNVNAAGNALKIQPRPNPLDQFASYTYSISVYLLSSTQYERLLRSKTKKIDGYFLLFQDGGAPVNRGGEKQGMATADISASDSGRNPFFPYDYYIDSLTLDTVPLGKATGASHMTASMKLVINEPNGITLIDNLYKAVANIQQKDGSGKVNYTAADYLAVIRFYGQGADGNPVQVRASGGAAIEKFIPFKLGGINWSVGSKMVTYEWDCVPQGLLIAGYTARGAIPHDVQITSTTIGKLLGSDVVYSSTESTAANPGKTTTAQTSSPNQSDAEFARLNRQAGNPPNAYSPPKAIAAPTSKKSITQGLMGALTKFQEELTLPQKGQSESIFNIADRYFIKFVDGVGLDGKVIPASVIENAEILPQGPERDNTTKASGSPVSGKSGEPQGLNPNQQAIDNASQSFSITAGQMITQAIDLAIRNSSYIKNQALVQQTSYGYQIPSPDKRNSPMSWFNIIMHAVPRPGGIDPKRNDHAFDITYIVKPYRLQNFNSKYFPPSRFAGVHKSYPYWFTGQNTAVVEYQETLNALYSITVSGSDPKNSGAAKIREAATASLRDIAKYNYAVTSGQSTHGSSDTRLNETSANAADYLFSPGDLGNAKVKILGDPDWIQQGSLFREITAGESQVADVTGFGEDGSISFETGDVLFEVVWQRPEDYDLNTGVADPYSGGYSGRANKTREPIQSRVYQANRIISEFRQGAFYQTIEGTLYQFPLPNKKNTVQASSNSTNSDALDEQRANNPNQTAAMMGAQQASGKQPTPTSTTGTSPTSATARGVQQLLSPPTTLSDPTLTQLQSSPVYQAARRSGQTPQASLDAARQAFAATAGGSPVTSNGQAVSTSQGGGPPKLGGGGAVSTNPAQQTMAKTT